MQPVHEDTIGSFTAQVFEAERLIRSRTITSGHRFSDYAVLITLATGGSVRDARQVVSHSHGRCKLHKTDKYQQYRLLKAMYTRGAYGVSMSLQDSVCWQRFYHGVKTPARTASVNRSIEHLTAISQLAVYRVYLGI